MYAHKKEVGKNPMIMRAQKVMMNPLFKAPAPISLHT